MQSQTAGAASHDGDLAFEAEDVLKVLELDVGLGVGHVGWLRMFVAYKEGRVYGPKRRKEKTTRKALSQKRRSIYKRWIDDN